MISVGVLVLHKLKSTFGPISAKWTSFSSMISPQLVAYNWVPPPTYSTSPTMETAEISVLSQLPTTTRDAVT